MSEPATTAPMPDDPTANWPAFAAKALSKARAGKGGGGRTPGGSASSKEGRDVTGNNVTLKLVSISSIVALAGFGVGTWVNSMNTASARHEAELTELRTIAKDMKAMIEKVDSRVKSLEDWRQGPRFPVGAPVGGG